LTYTPRPYKETRKTQNSFIREFSQNTRQEDLLWHKDRKDRIIRIIKSDGWKLQLAEGLPFPLLEGKNYFIPSHSWHRVVRGNGHLKILIQEKDKMKITESQLRKIVRQEILREAGWSHLSGRFDGPDEMSRDFGAAGSAAASQAREAGLDSQVDELISSLIDKRSKDLGGVSAAAAARDLIARLQNLVNTYGM